LLALAQASQNSSSNDPEVAELQPHHWTVIRAFAWGEAQHRFVRPQQETQMNWEQIQGDWMLFKGNVRANWVKISDEDLTRIGGRREELVKRLQARYGFAKNEAEREVDAWMKTQRYAA
jgi:uncharacterized protein YjbJ (UPF0337 family)